MDYLGGMLNAKFGVLVAFATIAISSCSQENSKVPQDNSKLIIGYWRGVLKDPCDTNQNRQYDTDLRFYDSTGAVDYAGYHVFEDTSHGRGIEYPMGLGRYKVEKDTPIETGEEEGGSGKYRILLLSRDSMVLKNINGDCSEPIRFSRRTFGKK